ncbi:hypothetical protein Nepgr_030980 [Nepenthes gracilis]|uniref:Uncharacterized protein n=1 Tax=Nepenthes gracilis TaxID=150966 RepID=A0AAD3TGP9_NEPGR|nr:hypothetical protein Nepgr_030980 [Nepenthes gracilis]
MREIVLGARGASKNNKPQIWSTRVAPEVPSGGFTKMGFSTLSPRGKNRWATEPVPEAHLSAGVGVGCAYRYRLIMLGPGAESRDIKCEGFARL